MAAMTGASFTGTILTMTVSLSSNPPGSTAVKTNSSEKPLESGSGVNETICVRLSTKAVIFIPPETNSNNKESGSLSSNT